MKRILALICIMLASASYGQNIKERYDQAARLLGEKNYAASYKIFKEIEPKTDKEDTLYNYLLWDYITSITYLEKQYRMQQNYGEALELSLETLDLIKKGMLRYNDGMLNAKQYWMYKNTVVNYFGLGKLDKAKDYQKILYNAYKAKTLPDGINEYYNFDFFKWEDKNVWGYEWYPELGDPETEGSFSKIVYYVYSTNPDGSDKDQLYRLHVLKFHKLGDDTIDFDYVLTKRLETAQQETNGTLIAYTYKSPVDYKKLRADIKEVLKGNYKPAANTTIRK